jgi:hypothetical protein
MGYRRKRISFRTLVVDDCPAVAGTDQKQAFFGSTNSCWLGSRLRPR